MTNTFTLQGFEKLGSLRAMTDNYDFCHLRNGHS
jgi:hypothetical protein